MQNSRCWARKLNDCSATISGEHRVSVTAWPGGTDRATKLKSQVFVRKGYLMPDGSIDTDVEGGYHRQHTLSTFTANVLCSEHNSRLSPVDVEAGKLTDAIHDLFETWKTKRAIRGLTYNPKYFDIDGPMIERWFIKTVISNTAQYGFPIGAATAPPGTPTDELVDIALGITAPSGHVGLHGASALGAGIDENDDFRLMDWYWTDDGNMDNRYVAGATYEYKGLRFILNLNKNVPVPLNLLRRTPSWGGTDLLSPLRLFQVPSAALYLRFKWPSERLPNR